MPKHEFRLSRNEIIALKINYIYSLTYVITSKKSNNLKG